MTNLTNQQAFDIAATHLLTQKERCLMAEKTRCAYRNGDGLKCAVGALIPDDLYGHYMEGLPVTKLITRYSKIHELFQNVDQGLLVALQQCHDNLKPPFWRDQLGSIATEYSLSPAVLHNLTTVK
jgi:hypothetical protein